MSAISRLESSCKVFKGYSTYEDAHAAWDGFTSTGHLPIDVAVSLGSRPCPIPHILLGAPHPHYLSSPTTPRHDRVYNPRSTSPLISQTLVTLHSGRRDATPFRLSSPHIPTRAGNCLNTMLPIVSSSGSMQGATAAAIILHEIGRAHV